MRLRFLSRNIYGLAAVVASLLRQLLTKFTVGHSKTSNFDMFLLVNLHQSLLPHMKHAIS